MLTLATSEIAGGGPFFTVPPMRVAFINSEHGWRGGEEHLRLLLAGLGDAIEPLVIAQPGSPLAERMRAAGVPVVEIKQGSGLDLGAVGQLRSAIARFATEVVVATTSRAHGLGLLATVGTGRPFIVTRHLDFPLSVWSGWKYQLTDHFIAVSSRVGETLIAGGISPTQITVVRNGIDPSPYVLQRRGQLRAELGIPANATLILSVGALTAQKDHATLFAAFAAIAGTRPDLWLAVLGGGERRDELQQLAATTGHGRVVFGGFRSDLPAVMADGDLLALTSRNEGLPLAVLEAQSAGLPTVATDAGGTRDVLDQTCGRLVPIGDVAAVASALAELADDLTLRARLGAVARARAIAYDHRAMAAGHLAVWQQALSGARP